MPSTSLPTSLAAVDSIYDAETDPNFQAIRIVYHAQYVSGELRDELEGTTDVAQWFTREEVEGLELVSIAELGVKLAFD